MHDGENSVKIVRFFIKQSDFQLIKNLVKWQCLHLHCRILVPGIPNGCLEAYEVKVDIDILQYQEKVKLISQLQRFFSFFNGLL